MARKRISTEMKDILQNIPEDKKAIAARIADELVFMQKTLLQLRKHIDEHGTIELFKNGSQEMLRESPALRSYNTTIQRYSTLYKQLTEMLPKDQPVENAGALYDFLKEGGNV